MPLSPPKSPGQLIARHGVRALVRKFCKNAHQLPNAIKQMQELVDRIKAITVNEHQVFNGIDIMVPSDPRYPWCDFAGDDTKRDGTAEALREHFKNDRSISVTRFTQGDVYVQILNYGVYLQARQGASYSLIISPESASYLTNDTATQMLHALCKGAKVTGVATNELRRSVLAGRVANMATMWDIGALMQVSGFDMGSEQIRTEDQKRAIRLETWDEEKGMLSYLLHGVEEVIPCAHLVRAFGPCIAPILPSNEDQSYDTSAMTPKRQKENEAKFANKLERQMILLAREGFSVSLLRGGVMKDYRHEEVFG